MKTDTSQHTPNQPIGVCSGGCLGMLVGAPCGAIVLLLWGTLSGGLISVGFGFGGLLYMPLFGVLIGGMIGLLIGTGVAEYAARHGGNHQRS